jgi:hypothetical protein
MKRLSKNTKTNGNQEDRVDSLEHKIKELEQRFEEIEEENVVFSRRVWFLFNELLDASYILAKIEKVLGAEKFKDIYNDYNKNEREGVMEYQREMARAGLYTLGFANLIDSKK